MVYKYVRSSTTDWVLLSIFMLERVTCTGRIKQTVVVPSANSNGCRRHLKRILRVSEHNWTEIEHENIIFEGFTEEKGASKNKL